METELANQNNAPASSPKSHAHAVRKPSSRPEISDPGRIRMGDCMFFTFRRPSVTGKK